MSDRDARELEWALRRDGRLGEFVFLSLDDLDQETLGQIVARALYLLAHRPQFDPLKRGLRDGERRAAGEITPEQLVAELREHYDAEERIG
jgi:hypothetical protein